MLKVRFHFQHYVSRGRCVIIIFLHWALKWFKKYIFFYRINHHLKEKNCLHTLSRTFSKYVWICCQLQTHLYSQLFSLSFRIWLTRCGSVLLLKTRWRFAAVCPNSYLLSTKWSPISSATNSVKSLWTLAARTGQCFTMISLQTPFR